MSKQKILRIDTGTIERFGEGQFARFKVRMAKPGVFPYLHSDGKILLEAKLPEEIFSPATIESAKNAPVTEEHVPYADGGLVTPENYSRYVKGSLGDSISVQDEYIVGHEAVWDSALKAKILSGEKAEVSIGFETDMDWTPGEWNGARYDGVQRNIRINHIAHVSEGRAGPDVRAAVGDSASGFAVQIMGNNDNKEKPMAGIKNDAKPAGSGLKNFILKLFRADSEQELANALEDLTEAKNTVDQSTPPASPDESAKQAELVKTLQTQVDALKTLLDQKTKELEAATAPAVMDSKIAERSRLLDAARAVVPDLKTDSLTDRQIRFALIEKVLPGKVKSDASDEILQAWFESALEIEREKALKQDVTDADVKIDSASLEKKRQARLNLRIGGES